MTNLSLCKSISIVALGALFMLHAASAADQRRGIWQEEGKSPVTLKAGDSLFVSAGTIHSHWNPSTADRLRFLEFIVAEKDKGRSIPKPQ